MVDPQSTTSFFIISDPETSDPESSDSETSDFESQASVPKINWKYIDRIFTEKKKFLPSIPEIEPNEIGDRVSRSDFDFIFSKSDRFDTDNYDYDLCRLKTSSGKESALVRTWHHINGNRLLFYILKDSFAIVFATPKTFLMVGNYSHEPFVYTPTFTFNDPDGYYEIDTLDFPSRSLHSIIELLQDTTLQYLFN